MSETRDPPDLPDDPRLMHAVQEFCEELEAGRRPNRQEFLRRYPDLAEPLGQCLAGLELVHKSAGTDKKPDNPHLSAGGPESALPTNPLGDFQIMREIGRGGMGIVYEAVQLSLGRRVALKVLPFAATFDAKHLQRFHNEAQAAAQLHHTNIVPIYFVGSERGVHFYAMQLIEGHSLAVVIRQIRKQVGRRPVGHGAPTGAAAPKAAANTQATIAYEHILPLPDQAAAEETVSQLALALSTQRASKHDKFFSTAARFVMQAAEALEHAHEFGIVHRDIKPANLLVDTHGRLWVTDFGLAQFHADAGLTRTGDIIGTLRYMSPEQASGQRVLLDHRTDVYSLGATLYELVTLEPIFPEQDAQALLYQIIHDEPRAPRAVEKSLPVDLETIILKAVSKNPSDRYATAQEFAADLQRYLEDKPIRAKRPSLAERVRKWSRRHPSWVAAAALLVLLGLVGLFVNNRLLADEKEKTKAALVREKQRGKDARNAVDLLVEISEEELADQPFAQTARKRLLVSALGYYQEFSEQQQDDANAQAELTVVRDRVQKILDELTTLQGSHQIFLVTDPAVQTDLKVSNAQKDKLSGLRDRWHAQEQASFGDHCQSPPAERRAKSYELAKAVEKALTDILDPPQLGRLKQIALQVQGSQAFHEPEVADALRLTADQKKKIKDIERTAFAKMRPGPRKGEDHRKDFAEAMQRMVEEIVATLDTEQRQRWGALTGERFQGGPMFPGPPPGPPPPR